MVVYLSTLLVKWYMKKKRNIINTIDDSVVVPRRIIQSSTKSAFCGDRMSTVMKVETK